MPTDLLLGTLLVSLQGYTEKQDLPRILSTAASLLSTLGNPLNLKLLSSQLLLAPAIWERPDGLQTCLDVTSVFHAAATNILDHERRLEDVRAPSGIPGQPVVGGGLPRAEWVRAVVKGADERSPRWRHVILLGGLLIGFEGHDRRGLSTSLRSTLESALVKAVNLALEEARAGNELTGQCTVLLLTRSFELLSNTQRSRVNYDRLLPVLVGASLFSSEGLQSGYIVGAIDRDIVQIPGNRFTFSPKSASYNQLRQVASRPLVSALGPLSRLMAHTVEMVHDSWLIQTMTDDIRSFSEALLVQWRQNKLSEIDVSEENIFLDDSTLKTTSPTLWSLLKSVMFMSAITLRSILGRVLGNRVLATDQVAPFLATQALHTLRNLNFISARLGSNAFSQYNFVYLSSIDILSAYAPEAEAFIKEIQPGNLGHIPRHPVDRCLDLFFLNTAEHFTMVLSSRTNEGLLTAAASPYLAHGGNNNLLDIFEAAHSVMLAVFSAPQNAAIAAKQLPFYVDALFKVFPENLSSRQFRLAFRTLLRITTPPSLLAYSQPLLASILLQLLYDRATHSPASVRQMDPAFHPKGKTSDMAPPLSEQAVVVLALLDTLPFLTLQMLEEWLPLAGHLVNKIQDEDMHQACVERFWEVLSSGEIDVERSQLCVAWWTTRGGKEAVLYGEGNEDRPLETSGALSKDSRL